MNIQPKPYINNIKLRNSLIGNELREKTSRRLLKDTTYLPKTVSYSDIDKEFQRFVNEDLDISYDGIKLPTQKLFSNQRISEFAQNWNKLDNMKNLSMNFKIVSRENNPQKGKIYGEQYNIPGERRYPMFEIPALQKNGQIGMDIYSMAQPMAIDLNYNVSIVTNKYELLNEFSTLVHGKFKALEYYIFPKGHAMSTKLDSVSDDTIYNIDDRKYYSQTYKIVVHAYIINEEDFSVSHTPFRKNIIMNGDKTVNKHNKNKGVTFEYDNCKVIEDENKYKHQLVEIHIDFSDCESEKEFIVEDNLSIFTIELVNTFDFIIYVNGEPYKKDTIDDIILEKGDVIRVKTTKKDYLQGNSLSIIAYNKDKIVKANEEIESSEDDESFKAIVIN